MTEDFLLRQAAAEILVIEQSQVQSSASHAILSAALWNWVSEYGRLTSPPALVQMSSMIKDHLAGKSSPTSDFFAAARTAVEGSSK